MMLLGSGPVHLNREELALYTYLIYPPRAPPTQLVKIISRLADGSRGLLFCAAKGCDSEEIAAGLNVKLWDSVTAG
jgi:hypothetical protein